MSAGSVTLSSYRPEDLPLFLSSHLAVQGSFGVGGYFAAVTQLYIYPDKAAVVTQITKYSDLPAETREQLDGTFSQDGPPDIVIYFPGPPLNRPEISREDYLQFVTKSSDEFSYPLVKHMTHEVSHSQAWETSVEKQRVKILVQTVTQAVQQCFPNQQKAVSESKSE